MNTERIEIFLKIGKIRNMTPDDIKARLEAVNRVFLLQSQ